MSYEEDYYQEDYYQEDYNDEYDDNQYGGENEDYSKNSEDGGEYSDDSLDGNEYSDNEMVYSDNEMVYSDEEDTGGADPSDYDRAGGGGDYLGDKFRFRSIRDIMIGRMYGILKGHSYFEFEDEIKKDVINMVEKIPEKKLINYNIDVLIPAVLYMAQYKVVSAKNIQLFIKKTSGLKTLNSLDFIRYVRIVKRLEGDGFFS
jgi:hypothetical protein